MKKITLLLLSCIFIAHVNAQIVYPTVLTETFETAKGFPADFNVLGQQAWVTSSATKNVNPYTGTIWKDLYSTAAAADKTYSANIIAEERAGGTGSQCLKFNLTALAFGSFETPNTIRLRSNNDIISFAATENIDKYEVTFWAKVDGDNKAALLNAKNPNEYLTITSAWQKYTIARYTTGTSSTALGIDFYPISGNTDFSVYMDDIEIRERKIAYTSAATDITANSFSANWSAVAGANSYSVIVEKTDGAETPTWTAITGSPFVAGNVQTLSITNLEAGTYRYRVTATDGTVTTVESNNSFATLAATGLYDIKISSLIVNKGNIRFETVGGMNIEIYNNVGQKIYNAISSEGLNTIQLHQSGVFIIKFGNTVKKLML